MDRVVYGSGAQGDWVMISRHSETASSHRCVARVNTCRYCVRDGTNPGCKGVVGLAHHVLQLSGELLFLSTVMLQLIMM